MADRCLYIRLTDKTAHQLRAQSANGLGTATGVATGASPGEAMKRLMSLDCVLEYLQRALTIAPNSDLTTRQVRAFLMMCKASIEGDPLTTEDLRRLLNLSSQTAHNTVTFFVERGLITREVATFDGRAKHLQLTDKGRSIAESLDNSDSVNSFSDAFRSRAKDSKDLFKELLNGTD